MALNRFCHGKSYHRFLLKYPCPIVSYKRGRLMVFSIGLRMGYRITNQLDIICIYNIFEWYGIRTSCKRTMYIDILYIMGYNVACFKWDIANQHYICGHVWNRKRHVNGDSGIMMTMTNLYGSYRDTVFSANPHPIIRILFEQFTNQKSLAILRIISLILTIIRVMSGCEVATWSFKIMGKFIDLGEINW